MFFATHGVIQEREEADVCCHRVQHVVNRIDGHVAHRTREGGIVNWLDVEQWV